MAHSRCTGIDILLFKKEIVLKDNGSGFNTEETVATKTDHFGLRSIQNRARIIGAKADITSSKEGTKIILRFKR